MRTKTNITVIGMVGVRRCGRIVIRTSGMLCMLVLVAGSSYAQPTRRSIELKATAGLTRFFLDEPASFSVGGAIRLGVADRVGLEPSFLYASDHRFKHRIARVSVAYDVAGLGRRSTLYLATGGGVIIRHDKLIDFTSTEASVVGAVGVRIRVGNRLVVTPEVRLGTNEMGLVWSLGYRLGQ